MILEVLIKMFLNLILAFIPLMPETNFVLPPDFAAQLGDLIASLSYFLPLGPLMFFVSFSITLDIVHLTWKGILRLKSFVPLWGD